MKHRKTSNYHLLNACKVLALRHQLPLIFFRLPEENTFQVIIGQKVIRPYSLDYTSTDKGFIFSPYTNFDNSNSIFIPAALYYRENGQFTCPEENGKAEALKSELVDNLIPGTGKNHYLFTNQSNLQYTDDLRQYPELVEKALRYIKDGHFEKVVLASRKFISLDEAIDPANAFLSLNARYKSDFVSMVFIPGEGTWFGASPELLLHVNHDHLSTVALAGTRTLVNGEPSGHIWKPKEYTEQDMVSRYILESIENSGFTEYTKKGPLTSRAGDMVHLKTAFRIPLNKGAEQKIDPLMQQLHPTPAICGLPKEAAQQFIDENEPFDRRFYAGFLGPVNMDQRLDLFVNLRCMNVCRNAALLYAGAGITGDSEVEAEFKEIELKFHTMEHVVTELQQINYSAYGLANY